MKCLPLHFRQLVVCDSICLSVEPVPDYLRLVVAGDDSGDDSGDEGSGRGREEEEDMEEADSPVVGQRLRNLFLQLMRPFTRLTRGHLLLRPSFSKVLKKIWGPLRKLTPNSRKNWRR
jgi:hypothetical protein